MEKVLAIVDHQNILNQSKEHDRPLEEVYKAILREAQQQGEVVDVRVFIPAYQDAPPEFWRVINELQKKYGVSVETCPVLRDVSEEKMFKDVVDLAILRWILQYHSCLGLVMFVTGDGDFIVAANELKKRGKKVIGRTVSFKNTGTVLFEVMPMRELVIGEKPVLASENNSFFWALAKATKGGEKLSREEKKKLEQLAKAEKILPTIIKGEMSLSLLKAGLRDKLNIEDDVCQTILEVLIGLEIIQCRPQMITAVAVQPSSQLQSLEASLAL